MNLDRVTPGDNTPEHINVIVEIPSHSDPVKYEVDKKTGAMFVGRFMNTAMFYPCNYDYIPYTLSEDDETCTRYRNIKEALDLGKGRLNQLAHFFEHYKDLEKDKWVKVEGWKSADEAKKVILASIERYNTDK